MLIFNARDPQYKSPIRAVATDEPVHLRLVVSRDMHCSGARLVVTKDGETPVSYGMFWAGMCGTEAEYWELHFAATTPGLYFYHFELDTPWGLHFVRNAGGGKGDFLPDGADFQQTVYDKNFQTPAFLRGGLIYQIFPDRFYNSGAPKTGVPATRVRRNWGEEPFWDEAQMNGLWNNDYFGGDLKGIAEKLPYIAKLGVTAIYLNPIFEAHSNHRYDTGDYEKIDPMLGDTEDLKYLCTQAKKLGIGVILDGVFSHTGSDSRYFNREGRYGDGGAYRDPNSPYRSWYDFDPKYKGGYRSWWGFETLPEVNEETPSYVEFITGEGGVIDTWLRRGAAGFRLDVADELPDEFIEKVRTAVKRVGPDKFLLGEVWEDATTKFGFDKRRTYLLGKGLDSVMNYPFKNAVLGFVCGRDAGQTMTDILSICEHYPAPALDTALNFLSTHDTERALTVIADEPANGRGREWQSGRCVTGDAYEEGMLKLRMAYAIIYTLPGVPCLYYGDEIGMQGYRDPFNRSFYCWDSHEERLKPVLAQLAQLRHTCEAFRTGELRVLRAEGGVLHYQRIGEFEAAEIIVNRTEHIIVEPLASGKHTEVNPMGFTIVVEEVGHNPNHSYYDYK